MKKLNRIEREWIESWTVEEAVAVYEFCTMMQDHLWQQHQIALNEHIVEREGKGDPDPPRSELLQLLVERILIIREGETESDNGIFPRT